MKKRLSGIIVMMWCFATSYADEPISLLNNYWILGGGYVTYEDAYLSNLKYSGWGLQWEAFHSNFYKKNRNISWQNRNTLLFAYTYNPPYTANILNINATIAFGTHYHFRITPQFVILVGGFWDIDGSLKYNNRNVNNIASADLSTNVYASTMLRYHLVTEKLQMAFEYDLQTPIIGCMFVPEKGISYYEYYLFQNLNNSLHFSSFHNKLGLRGNLSIDFIFSNFTFRMGFVHNNTIWRANGLHFEKEHYLLDIGTVINLGIFGGKKNEMKNTDIWK